MVKRHVIPHCQECPSMALPMLHMLIPRSTLHAVEVYILLNILLILAPCLTASSKYFDSPVIYPLALKRYTHIRVSSHNYFFGRFLAMVPQLTALPFEINFVVSILSRSPKILPPKCFTGLHHGHNHPGFGLSPVLEGLILRCLL